MKVSVIIQERFWSKVRVEGLSECWTGRGARRSGYGHIGVGNHRTVSAHRLSWEIHFGPIPEGKCILHRCDNKLCVNPGHLYLGNYSDNMFDRVRRNPQSLKGRGQGLEPEEDREVLRLYSTGEFTQECLAHMFSCSQSNINKTLRVQGIIEGKELC